METISHSGTLIDKLEHYAGKRNEPLYKLLMRELDISQDAAYRRINCKVPFTFEEVVALSSKLNFSIDEMVGKKGSLIFNYKSLEQNDFLLFCSDYLNQLAFIFNYAGREGARMYYAATDIPIYLAGKYPRILAFKIHCWKNDMLGRQDIAPFMLEHENYELILDELDALVLPFDKINSIEFYNARTFSLCLNYMTFYRDLGCLSEEGVALMKADLLGMIDDLEEQAAEGVNRYGGRTVMYLTPFDMEGTKILVSHPENSASFVKLYLLNGIWTQDHEFCKGQLAWFNALTDTATLITRSSIRERKLYFANIREQIKIIE